MCMLSSCFIVVLSKPIISLVWNMGNWFNCQFLKIMLQIYWLQRFCHTQSKRTNSQFGNCSGERLGDTTYYSAYVSDVQSLIAKSILNHFFSYEFLTQDRYAC